MLIDPRAAALVKSVIGETLYEELQKVEIYKVDSNTTLDPHEIQIALQIVPKSILGFLFRELNGMTAGSHKRVVLPLEPNCVLEVNKHGSDVYSGSIVKDGKIIDTFSHRAIPGVGLHIMSAFELYDKNNIMEPKPIDNTNLKILEDKIDNAVIRHVMMNKLIDLSVDKKLAERDLMDLFLKTKLQELFLKQKPSVELAVEKVAEVSEPSELKETALPPKKSELPLKNFLEKVKKKKQPLYSINIEKNEKIKCPDCNKVIFDESKGYSGCICFGLDRNKKIFLKKTESGIKIKFSSNWEPENIEMLLDILRSRRKKYE